MSADERGASGSRRTSEPSTAKVTLLCLNCHKPHEFDEDSLEARGIFNVFCDGECEDTYAGRL